MVAQVKAIHPGSDSEKPKIGTYLAMFYNMMRASPVPESRARPTPSVLQQPCTRQAYLQRLGIQSSADIEKPVRGPCPDLSLDISDASTDLAADETKSIASDESTDSSVPGSSDDIRQKYLRKLAYSKVWVPQARRVPKHQTVTIFDWDDTLLCTSWLRRAGDVEDGTPEADHIRAIAGQAKCLLETAAAAGHTYIITNAMSGWVEYSAARWAPELLSSLRKVKVISARDRYEAAFPDDVGQWKIEAFLEVQWRLGYTPITNLVALGDAYYEMEAARIMGEQFEEGLVKTVKLRPEPCPKELLQQLELISKNLPRILQSAKSLKMNFEAKST